MNRGLRHITIVGLPGTGKTCVAVRMYKRTTHSVFVNVGHEDVGGQDPNYFQGEHMLTDMRQVIDYLFEGGRCVWTCNYNEVRPFIGEVIRRQREREEKYPLHLFIDEAHLVAPAGSINIAEAVKKGEEPNEFNLLATNGRRWNIQAVWITQRPQNLDYNCYKTAEHKIFFRLDPGDTMYFRRMGVTLKEKEGYDWEVRQS